jgi:hypothetical protein
VRRRAFGLYLLLGGVVFAAQHLVMALATTPDRGREIVISGEQVEALKRQAERRWGQPMGPDALKRVVDAEVEDELLFREALRLGLDRRDAIVERRLLQNMRFLIGDEEQDPGVLLQEARELGMVESDIVVRRRLIQRMRLAIEAQTDDPPPSEAELEAHLAGHPDAFRTPTRVRISQLFFAPNRTSAEVTARFEALVAAGAPPSDSERGDPFLIGRDLPLESVRGLAKLFGPDFAGAVVDLDPGRWHGPVASTYGQHLVWMHERTEGGAPRLASVRSAVHHAVLAERSALGLRAALDTLRANTLVVVEPIAQGAQQGM